MHAGCFVVGCTPKTSGEFASTYDSMSVKRSKGVYGFLVLAYCSGPHPEECVTDPAPNLLTSSWDQSMVLKPPFLRCSVTNRTFSAEWSSL